MILKLFHVLQLESGGNSFLQELLKLMQTGVLQGIACASLHTLEGQAWFCLAQVQSQQLLSYPGASVR